jgi:hypothetical protein
MIDRITIPSQVRRQWLMSPEIYGRKSVVGGCFPLVLVIDEKCASLQPVFDAIDLPKAVILGFNGPPTSLSIVLAVKKTACAGEFFDG